MGLDGEVGTICVDLQANMATTTEGHSVVSLADGKLTLKSRRYPFCARGDLHADSSIRSGMTLVPFMEDLSRFILKVSGVQGDRYRIAWGQVSREFAAEQLEQGVVLPVEFPENPFCEAFDRVDHAVAAKQAYETIQVKTIFHGPEGRSDFDRAVIDTEAVRKPLADAIAAAMVPVTHTIEISRCD